MLERIKIRLQGESFDDALLMEYIQTAKDRIALRVGRKTFPEALSSIAVEVVVKMARRKYFEGLSAESVDGFSPSFIEDILDEYEREFASFQQMDDAVDRIRRGKVRFL